MLKYKEEEKSLKQYISDNNDKIQNMNQDSHNVAVALLNQNLPKLIDNMSNKIDIKKEQNPTTEDRCFKKLRPRSVRNIAIINIIKATP